MLKKHKINVMDNESETSQFYSLDEIDLKIIVLKILKTLKLNGMKLQYIYQIELHIMLKELLKHLVQTLQL